MQRNHLHLLNFYSSTYYFYFITPFHLRSIVCPLQGIFLRLFCVFCNCVALGLCILLYSMWRNLSKNIIRIHIHILWMTFEWGKSEKKWQRFKLLHSAHFRKISWIMMSTFSRACFFSCLKSSLLSPCNKNCMHSFCCMLFISVALYLFCGIFVYFFVFECIIMFDFSHPDLWWFFEDFRYNCLFSQCGIVSANLKTCICDSFNSINIIVRWLFQIPFVPLTISAHTHTHKHTQRTH